MKKSIKLWQLWGFASTSLLGTLLHFLYDWTQGSKWAAPFSGVNESTWEHMKLIFWPMLIFAVIQSFFFKEQNNFWCIKLKGTALAIILIPTVFYLYNGVIGKSPDWINISIFFLCTAIAYIYESRQLSGSSFGCKNPKIAIALLLIIAALFVIFTFITPKINLFKDPITGSYGI